MSLEGQQIGEFEILARLGQGGMGAVYQARQTSLDRLVAIKTLQASLAEDAEYIARFRQEAKAAAGLNHPNLVQVISAGESQGLHWFAMEYIEGESAKVRVKRKGRLEPLEAVTIGLHVATALDYGWRKARLIHRDVKPDNIFLSRDGDVKLGDLGLAKSVGQGEGLTSTGHSLGTPHYISPEQVEATKDVDLRADIYSLGCTLYHLLSGLPPYQGNSAVSIMMKHVTAPVPNLRGAWPECPPELATLVMKMMLKPPEARPQNYEEVMAGLRRIHALLSGAGAPSVVSAPRPPAAAPRPVVVERKRPVPGAVWIGGVAALVAALAALAFLAPWKKAPAPSEEPRAAVAKTSNSDGGGKADVERASPPESATPVPGQTAAVANTPPPIVAPVPTTPAPTPEPPAPAAPASSTPVASSTPRPPTEVEKWFAQVDGPQEEAFQKQVTKPFEAGVADLRARYLAALDAAISQASAAGDLGDALAWRTEREAFARAQNVPEDDAQTLAGLKTLRAAFRQQLTKLDQDRLTQAKTLFAQYDPILAKNQTLLTQHQRLDDALLLKTKRDAIAKAWLAPSTLITVAAVESAEPTNSIPTATPLTATKENPFVNSLGMKFAPVPIVGGPTNAGRVLFSVWDTRIQDYEAFVGETQRHWAKTNFEQGPTHPVVAVNWEDAQAFCQWLTGHEKAAGRLPEDWSYRLPSDHEWSCAVGIGAREDASKLPFAKSQNIYDAFPWGTQWPPPKGAGNYAGEELKSAVVGGIYSHILPIAGYNDGFVNTSPVGSFAPNKYGLYDMGGNVCQFCEDWFDTSQQTHVLRGSSWNAFIRSNLLSSYRFGAPPHGINFSMGIRCVLAPRSMDHSARLPSETPGKLTPVPTPNRPESTAAQPIAETPKQIAITFPRMPPYSTPVDSFGTIFPGLTLSSGNQWEAGSINREHFTILTGRTLSTESNGPLTITFTPPVQNLAMNFGGGRKGEPVTAEVKGYRNDQLIFTSRFTTRPGPKGGEEVHAQTKGTVDRIAIRMVTASSSLILGNLAYDDPSLSEDK
jgi:hypothetical protein